jgi:type IV pilus assembly protein PilO
MENSLTRLPWYGQVGAFVALGLAGCCAFYYYYEVPRRAEMAGLEAQLAALQTDIAKGVEITRTLKQFERDVSTLEGRLTELREVLPEEKDAADLLRAMQTVAAQSNLTIKSFKPAAVVTKQLHAEWPINLELDGTYHNLALFFDRVGKFARIVNISSLTVQGKTGTPGSATITAGCVATTFVLLDTPAPAAVPAANGGLAKKVA